MATENIKTSDSHPEKDANHDRRGDDRDPNIDPYLVIPYYAADIGVRPLPATVVAWFCESIFIDGVPHTGAPLIAGSTVMISAMVKNAGVKPAAAYIRFYWLDPTTVFTQADLADGFIGQGVFPVSIPGSSGGVMSVVESPAIAWEIPDDIPPHICLFAEVGCPGDLETWSFNPVTDRHYAQHNVNIVHAMPFETTSFFFSASNPLKETALYEFQIRPVSREALRFLEKQYRAKAIPVKEDTISLYPVKAGSEKNGQKLHASLRPNEKQLFRITIDMPELRNNEFLAVEVEQTLTSTREEQPSTGSIGVLFFTESEREE
ncbi:hypothetical protein QNI16_05715 [Cytophagaceae bacterium YF14B1]|uniref:CARDB domain-containing protein n=1 Tax=Xanthocytophaga flava TaxID=3048013 RepID=A0AAE3QM54_9BACT|nr:hypothetical protein [Xanthocytophaga flavus]MDJ1479975.1 hypothetical protein [Xanthocytophaga flavus]